MKQYSSTPSFPPSSCPFHPPLPTHLLPLPLLSSVCPFLHFSLRLIPSFLYFSLSLPSPFTDPTCATSIIVLLWQYYCTALALPNTSPYTMQAYHVNLVKLPWRDFLPDLTTLDYMTKLKLMDNFPPSSFIFLGRIFPQFNWKTIVAAYW